MYGRRKKILLSFVRFVRSNNHYIFYDNNRTFMIITVAIATLIAFVFNIQMYEQYFRRWIRFFLLYSSFFFWIWLAITLFLQPIASLSILECIKVANWKSVCISLYVLQFVMCMQLHESFANFAYVVFLCVSRMIFDDNALINWQCCTVTLNGQWAECKFYSLVQVALLWWDSYEIRTRFLTMHWKTFNDILFDVWTILLRISNSLAAELVSGFLGKTKPNQTRNLFL